ncbi:MAG: fibronectin type III domain-containing protein [Bacteroidales bacterium]
MKKFLLAMIPAMILAAIVMGQSLTVTYTVGDIETDYQSPWVGPSTCPGVLTATIPSGNWITGVDVTYAMTAANGGWTADQRSKLFSPTTGLGESDYTAGTGNSAGTQVYTRTALTFANSATGTVTFHLDAGRVFGNTAPNNGCSLYYNKVDNNTWTLTVYYAPIPSCPPPFGLTVTNVSTTTAVLGWTSVGSETTWNIKYGTPGFDPLTQGTLVAGVTTNPYTLTGLTMLTSYEFYVQADCGGGDLSTWGGPLAFQTTSTSLSGNYTINSTLPTGGTNYINFTDFATAINQGGFAGPVIVDVVAGTGPYTEQVILGELPNSSSSNTLTINGNGEILQYLSTNTNERATLKYNGTDYVTVNNLIIKALGSVTGEYGWAVWLTNGADYNNFMNCEFIATDNATLTNFAGFITSNSATGATTAGLAASNLKVIDCIVHGGYYAMVINGPTSAPFSSGNVIMGNQIRDFYLYGLYLRGQNNSNISANQITRPTRSTVSTFYGIYMASDMTGTTITKNRIFNMAGNAVTTSTLYGFYGTGVTATAGQELLIANNVISGTAGMNGTQYGMYLLTTSNAKVYHNSIALDNLDHPGTSLIRGLHHSGTGAAIEIVNNIISVTTNSTGIKYCLYFATNSAIVTTNYNVLHMGSFTNKNIGYWDAVSYPTLADWQTANSGAFDQNSIDADPLYASPPSGNLTPGNPLLDDMGTNLLAFVPDDINGVARTATPDPGAYEFESTGCIQPAGQAIVNISTTTATLDWVDNNSPQASSWDIELGLTGFTPTGTPTVSGVTKPYNYTGLTAQTTYDWYVRANCGGGELSPWIGPHTFQTTGDPLSGNYTINSTLPTGGTNFASFTDLADALNLGGFAGPVIVDVVTGTGPYNEQVILGELPNSSDINTLTINGNGETLEYLSLNTNERATFKLNGTDYVTVDNLVIKALGSVSGEYGWAVWLTNNADYNIFSNCSFIADQTATLTNFAGFVTTNSPTGATTAGLAASNLKVIDCQVIGGYYGMIINGPTTGPYAENNLITGNEIRNFHLYGMYVRGQNNSLITENTITRPDRATTGTLYMIYLTSNMNDTEVTKNRIYDFSPAITTTSTGYGIYATTLSADPGQELLIANNVIYGYQNMNGIQYGMYFSTSASLGNLRIYHNSVSPDNLNHAGSSSIYGLYFTGTGANLDIRNNIISYTTNSSGTKYCLYFSGATQIVTSNYNVLHRGATSGTNNTGYWGTAFPTLADWKTANGGIYDQNSIDADPIFSPPLITPSGPDANDMGTNLLAWVPDDIFGVARTATPDPGAIEFTPVAADISVLDGNLVKTTECLSANDSVYITIKNVIGNTIDFSVDPLTIYWEVDGPASSSGTVLINNGTLDVGNDFTAGNNGVDMSLPGIYVLSKAYIQPSALNLNASNDTIYDAASITIAPYVFDAQPDYTLITTSAETVELTVNSNLLPGGDIFITEICHFRGSATGAPVGGWPSYLIADDYIEITGVPNADLSGYILEMWSATAQTSSQVLGTGTVLSPWGTCIIATGQLGSSVPSPLDYYYHSGYTGTMGSTTSQGYILKDPGGSIVDAVIYGSITFPAASGVTPDDWTGVTPAVSSAGNRLEGPYTKDATNWINSGVSPQDPNTVNFNVTVPVPGGLTNFTWSLDGVITSYNNPDTIVGPWTLDGIYNYVATYTNACGTFIDTAVVEVIIPQLDLELVEVLSPAPEVCSYGTEDVSIALTNLGANPIAVPFSASYTIDNGIPVTETVSLVVAPADTVIYTFTAPVSIPFTGPDTSFFLNVYVNLPGDPFQWNDTIGYNVTFLFAPPAPIVVNDTVDFGETATLEAISTYDVNWYAEPFGGDLLYTGQYYTTPPLYATTPYYAAAALGGGSAFVGPPDPSIGASASFTATVQFLIFDVLNPSGIHIKTVDIYPTVAAGAAYTMVIQDAGQQVIWSFPGVTTVAANTKETVQIDADIPFGSGYRFGFSVNPGMTRNSTGAAYPYTLPGEVSITGNTFNPTYYYFFYNWEVGAGTGCESDRVEVLAVVNLPDCVPIMSVNVDNLTPTTADLWWLPGGDETAWEIELGNAGFTPTGVPTHFISVNPSITLTGLIPATTYDFYIRSDCGTEYSDWAGPYTFQTEYVSMSGYYTINSTLPTSGTNFASFTAFTDAITLAGFSGPVVVDVIAGTGPYTEQVMLGQLPNSSDINTITINGNGETLQFLSTNTNERATFKLNGTDYITVENLVIKALGSVTGEFGWAVWLTNNADYNTFNNCQFIATQNATLTNFAAFVTSSSATGATTAGAAASHLTVNNSVSEGGYYGMVINGPTSAPFADSNVITKNQVKDFYLYGLYVRGNNNSFISENTITRPNRPTVSTFYGIYMASDMTGTSITKNRIFDLAGNSTTTSAMYGFYGTGVTATTGQELLIANNVISGTEGMNGTQYGMYLLTTNNAKVYHNSISLDNVNHPGSSLIRGIHHSGTSAVIEILNNVISVTSNSTGTKYCMYFATNTAIVTSNYNVLHMGATAGTNHTGYWSTVSYTTLADWQTANGGIYDQNSVNFDPLFAYSPGGNLMPGNPLIDNIGTNLIAIVPDDINGVLRTITPDPGAYEFTPSGCIQPGNLYAANILGTQADLGWTDNNVPPATLWDIELGLAGFTPTGVPTVAGVTSNPYTYTGLSPNTTYHWYVRSNCGGGELSIWVGPHAFTTACATFPVPFYEPFQLTTIPNCWSMSGPQPWLFTTSWPGYGAQGLEDHTGTGGSFAGVDGSGSAGLTGITLETPYIDVSSYSLPELQFYLFNNNINNADWQSLRVDLWNGTTWVESIYFWGPAMNSPTWVEVNVMLAPYNITGDIKIRFVVDKSTGSPFYDDLIIDDVRILQNVFGTLAGVVTELATGQPIQGATVSVGNVNATTQSDGSYTLNVLIGSYDATCSAVGYNPQTLPVTILDGQITTQNFALTAPVFVVNPDVVNVVIMPGQTVDQTVNLSNTGNGPGDWNAGLVEIDSKSPENLFDLQFQWPTAGSTGESGVATDGNFIYTSTWNSSNFHKYTMDGTYVGSFTVGPVSGIRDLTYDGTHFYGSAANTTVFEMDLANATLIGSFTAPTAVRALAYDEAQDAFYANNLGTDIIKFNKAGANLGSFPVGPFGTDYYGFAVDNYSPGAPYLWGYARIGATMNQLVQMQLPSGTETGVTFDVGSVVAVGSGLAGGLTINKTIVPGLHVLTGIVQGQRVWGLELTEAGPDWLTLAPIGGTLPAGQNQDITLSFDAGSLAPGLYEAELHFNFVPAVGSQMIPITMLIESTVLPVPTGLTVSYTCTDASLTWDMPAGASPDSWNVYRDGTLLENVATMSYTDPMLDPDTEYCYEITAVYGMNESDPTAPGCVTIPVPANIAPTGLAGEPNIPNGNNITLTWTAPTGCLTPDGYNVYRDGVQINPELVTTLTFIDELEETGTYEYAVTAVYYFGESELSETVSVYIEITGIALHYQGELLVFPIPAADYVQIQAGTELVQIILLDNAGKVVKSEQAGERHYRMDVTHLERGIYYLRIETHQGMAIRKLTIN